jgi:mucin-19
MQPKTKNILQISLTVLISVLVVFSIVKAGSLTPPGAPGVTMNTLDDIWNKLHNNTVTPHTSLNPASGPASTMHSLADIYNAIVNVPDTPAIGTATAGSAQAVVSFIPPGNDGGSVINSYTVSSSSAGPTISAAGASSPITVLGLANGTAYTFTVTATNAVGTSLPSGSSNSVTPAPSFSATGGIITHDGAYTIHTFTSNGQFNVTGSGNVAVLVVAGGGGGGNTLAGGGGAGGLIYNPSYAINGSQIINISVGSGGIGGPSYAVPGTDGGNSIFGSITATGGGGGGVRVDNPSLLMHGRPGGSGGGGGGGQGTKGLGGAAFPAGQGNKGGDAYGPGAGASSSGGGGGGAGGAGSNGSSSLSGGGNGGLGLAYSISGPSVTYSVGGKGGDYNDLNGARDTNPGAGGGGGGNLGGAICAGTNGLPGIVIVRYLTQ